MRKYKIHTVGDLFYQEMLFGYKYFGIFALHEITFHPNIHFVIINVC